MHCVCVRVCCTTYSRDALTGLCSGKIHTIYSIPSICSHIKMHHGVSVISLLVTFPIIVFDECFRSYFESIELNNGNNGNQAK